MSRQKITNSGRPLAEAPSRSPEEFLTDQLSALKINAQRCLDDVGAHTRLHPHKTLLWALGAGYVLRVLPTTRILGGVTHLAVVLLKPAALIYGVSKLWHATQRNGPPPRTREVS